MANLPVKWLKQNLMGGVTQLESTTPGTFVAQLKEFLITGFNDQTPTTATYAGGVVTLTFAAAHGFIEYQVIEVTGATEAEYNGTFRVVDVEDVTAFTLTYVPDVVPPASTTGTINVKQPPVGGWEILYEDIPNYYMTLGRTHPDATPYVMRIHNSADYQGGAGSNSWWAQVLICANYVDHNTYDLIHTMYWPASNRYDSATDSQMYADDRLLYHLVGYGNSSGFPTVLMAGDINSIIPGDRGHFATCRVTYDLTGTGAEWDNATDDIRNYFPRNYESTYKVMMTEYHNLPGTIAWYSTGQCQTTWGALLAHPNAANNGLILSTQPMGVLENGSRGVTLRGFLPGLLEPLNWSSSFHKQVTSGHPGIEDAPVAWTQVANHVDNVNSGTGPFAIRLDNWREQVG